MSLVEEPSQENDQKEPQICLQEDDVADELDPEDQKVKHVRMKDLKSQRDKRTISRLSLLKEDFYQFKEDVLKVFRDKDTNTEHEDRPSSQAENKPANSTPRLPKEDFSQFKEDVLKVFRDKDTEHEDRPSSQAENKPANSTPRLLKEDFSQAKEDVTSSFKDKEMKVADPKTSQSTEKTINRLSLFKEDLNHFKEDLSNVFRIGLSKEKDNKGVNAKEDSSNTFKIKDSRAEKADEPFKSLFRRDQKLLKTSQTAENSQGVEKAFSEKSEEQMDDGFRGNLSEQNEDTVDAEKMNMKDRMNELKGSEQDVTVSEEKTETTTSLSETQQSEEMIPTSPAAEQTCESEDWSDDSSSVTAEDERINEEEEEEEEDDKPSETLPWESLSSEISLLGLTDPNRDDTRVQPGGGLWWVKNFACYLTFDPNTANSELRLSDCNRKATRVWSDHRPSDHPDRFKHCPQVLCREGLLDPVYWEVVWSGGADIGVTYNTISRDEDTASCLLGHNERSWSLECSEGSYTPCHDNKRFRSSSPRPFTHRVGVYLDWFAGSLSFYCVSQDTMVHLHTFTSTFTEPLYPGFWVWAYDSSVSLCQVELDWERLLQ